MGGHSVHLQEEPGLARDRRLVTIDTLPDYVLVEIFDFCVDIYDPRRYALRHTWYALVHVCPRWRYLVFASSRRLDLRVEYGGHRPMSEVLDAWPVLPVILASNWGGHPKSDQRWDNLVAALESEHYCNRICEIRISNMTSSRWERFTAAMQKPFPELTHLSIWGDGDLVLVPVLRDSFLGGSASRLRTLFLESIPFPSMPKLLLSANGLVTLTLPDIPDSAYISPDAMATALRVMTRLEFLRLGFRSPRSRPDPATRPLPPPTRFIPPALTVFQFEGVHEYLEDLLAQVDAPLLRYLYITFFMDLNFDLPQLRRLIGHVEEFKAFDYAGVSVSDHSIKLDLSGKTGGLKVEINCKVLEWQLSSLAQVCSSFPPLISTLEELDIKEHHHLSSSHWKDDIENTQWLELLDPFTALKNLYLTDKIALRVCSALLELSGEGVTEVFPALQNLFISPEYLLEDSRKAIKMFVAAQRRSGRRLSVHSGPWGGRKKDITEDLTSED